MKNTENKKYIKLGITGVAVIVASLLCFFLLFRLSEIFRGLGTVAGILSPFLYGAAIAYILTPMCNKFEVLFTKLFHPSKEKQGMISTLSITLSLILAIALVFVLVVLIIPQVWESIVNIANAIPGELAAANVKLQELLENRPELLAYWNEFYGRISDGIMDWLKTDLLPKMGTVISEIGYHLAALIGFFKNIFLGMLISIYFLSSRKKFAAQSRIILNSIFPRRCADMIEEEVRFADKMFNGFLMGKLLDSAIIGVICFIVTAILGFRSAALISVVVGATNIIPFFGPFIGAIPSAILLLFENPMHCRYFLIFIVILQQLDGNIIGPKILGNTTGLSSFWVLFSILLFGGLWGIAGMIIGVPLFAVIYDIVRRLAAVGLQKHERSELLEEYDNAFHPAPTEAKSKKRSAKRAENLNFARIFTKRRK